MASASAIATPRERPILFSGPMVNAVYDELKTQTRRIVKWPAWVRNRDDAALWLNTHPMIAWYEDGLPRKRFGCPYGVPGDRLWVKETWKTGKSLDPYSPSKIRAMALEAGYRNAFGPLWYAADRLARNVELLPDFGGGFGKTRVSIHMPRWASRINLEVLGVRVERLRDISEADAKAEGVELDRTQFGDPVGRYYTQFAELWASINGIDSWHANPWVWVVDFRRVP